jgi:hypothetical protein
MLSWPCGTTARLAGVCWEVAGVEAGIVATAEFHGFGEQVDHRELAAPETVIQCCEQFCEAIVDLWLAVGSFIHPEGCGLQYYWGTE